MISSKAKIISLSVALLLLSFQFFLQVNLAKEDSQTTDEAIHLYAGYRYLTHADFAYNPEHPPLVKYLAAFPLLFMNIHEPESIDEYSKKTNNFFFWGDTDQSKVAEDFLFNSGNDPQKVLFWGRIPMVILTLMLGALIYLVGVYVWGWWGGLLALAVFAFDPTVNGHGHLVTTDIGSAFGVLLALFTFWLFLQKRSFKRATLFGVATGIALLMKFSTLLLGPTFIVVLAYHVFIHDKERTIVSLKDSMLKLLVSIGVAWIVLIAGYQFHFAPPPHEDSVIKAAQEANHLEHPWIADTPFINNAYNAIRHGMVPGDYFRGLISFTNHATNGHPSYLFGKSSEVGWKYYFPVLFTAKLMIPVLILLFVSIVAAIKFRREYPFGMFILLSFFTYFLFSTFSKVNIGIRHIMPVFPLSFILIGGLAAYPFVHERIIKRTLIGIMFFTAILFLNSYPFYLSYFSALYGGSYEGYKTADDSNLDWGQDLYRIQSYIKEHNIEHVYLEYNWEGESSLTYFNFDYTQLSDFDQDKDHGIIIICATSLIQPAFNWLLKYPIYDRVSPSVFVYKI